MITVTVYGLDQFVVGDISHEATSLLAKLYEVNEDEVNFIAPNTMVFHKGVEQTSWNVIVHVNAPKKVSVLQADAAKIIFVLLKEVAIHVSIEFYYYSADDRVVNLNPDYPRYMSEDNIVHTDDCHCEDLEEGEGEDQVYTGDIFKDFTSK